MMKYPLSFALLLLLCLPVAQTKRRGVKRVRKLEKAPRKRELNNIFDVDTLRHSLQAQRDRVPYEDPFQGEPTLHLKHDGRTREFRKKKSAKKKTHATAETITATTTTTTTTTTSATTPRASKSAKDAPVLHVASKGKGKSKSTSYSAYYNSGGSSSKSKGKGKSKGSGKSKATGKSGKSGSKGKSASVAKKKSKSMMKSYYETKHPTPAPSGSGNLPPSTVTPRPTCPPGSGFFPPEVSGFFGSQTGSSGGLQQELDSILNQIQVPNEFGDQCLR